jgi:hypothetical protein
MPFSAGADAADPVVDSIGAAVVIASTEHSVATSTKRSDGSAGWTD